MIKRYCIDRAWWVRCLVVTCVFASLAVPHAVAQNADNIPYFNVDVIATRGDASSAAARIDLYTKIGYPFLRFVNGPNGFEAKYEVMVDVFEMDERDRPRNLVQNPIWDRTVTTDIYASTQDRRNVDKVTHTISLEPGRYLMQFQVEDQETNESFVQEVITTIRDFDKSISVSDLILLDSYVPEENSINPRINARFGTGTLTVQFFYDIYAEASQSVQITRSLVRTQKNTPIIQRILGKPVGQSEAEEGGGEISFSHEEISILRAGSNPIIAEIPLSDMQAGEYTLRVEIADEAGRVLDVAEKVISAEWSGLAAHLDDFDKAIDQLHYIADASELRHIRQGEGQVEQLTRFNDFWRKRDPTPGTDRNEKMEEYYYRINYANRQYGQSSEGWKTDRGQVVVLFGEPDHVERHPYSYNTKPYEVWYYHRIGRQYIFIDETGLGDYRLLVPIYDERTRIR